MLSCVFYRISQEKIKIFTNQYGRKMQMLVFPKLPIYPPNEESP